MTSRGFVEAANALTDALVDSGFDPYEARASIKPQTAGSLYDGLPDMPLWNPVTEVLQGKPTLEAIPEAIRQRVQTAPARQAIDTGAADITATLLQYAGPAITRQDENAWKAGVETAEEKKAVERLARKSRGEDAWPAAMGEKFSVPFLAVRRGRQFELFEDQFHEGHWPLSECDSLLGSDEFRIDDGPQTGAEIDVEKGKIGWRSFTDNLHRQLSFLDTHAPRTQAELALWLDRNTQHKDVTAAEAGIYMMKAVGSLLDKRNLQRDQFAFWLQTRTDKFYPDFVAKLRDGRFLAVEFKGGHLESGSDAAEKDALGQLWEARGKGLCLFRMVTKRDMQSRIREAVSGRRIVQTE